MMINPPEEVDIVEEVDMDEVTSQISSLIESLAKQIQSETNPKDLLDAVQRAGRQNAEFREAVKKTSEKTKSQLEEMNCQLQNFIDEKLKIQEELTESKTALMQAESEKNTLYIKIEELKRELESKKQEKPQQIEFVPSKPVQTQDLEKIQQIFNKQVKEAQEFIETVNQEKKELRETLKSLQSDIETTSADNDTLKSELMEKRTEIIDLKTQNSTQLSEIEKLQADVTISHKEIERLKELLKQSQDFQSELRESLQLAADERSKNLKEINILKKNAESANNEKDIARAELMKATAEIESLKAELHVSKNESNADAEHTKKFFEAQVKALQDELAQSNKKLEENSAFFSATITKSQEKDQENLQSLSELHKKLNEKQSLLDKMGQDAQIFQLKRTKHKQQKAMNSDLTAQVRNLEGNVQTMTESNQTLKDEITTLMDLVKAQALKNQGYSRQLSEVNQKLATRDAEEARLRHIISKYKAIHPNYIASKDDPVDSALAEYINALDEPLEIQFIREDPGIYTFGSKRVFVKLEQNRIIIRVGGGYMTIDEFIQMFTVSELERLNGRQKSQKDPHRLALYSKLKDSLPPSPKNSDPSLYRATKVLRVDPGKGFTPAYGISKRPGTPSKPSPTPGMRKRTNSVNAFN